MSYPRFNYGGNFYVADICTRCFNVFYIHAMQNMGMLPAYQLCPWCRGECSAAEQDHRNAAIEFSNVLPEGLR